MQCRLPAGLGGLAFQCDKAAQPQSQALPIKGSEFNARVKVLAGPEFSSHSFRRGGAGPHTHCLSASLVR